MTYCSLQRIALEVTIVEDQLVTMKMIYMKKKRRRRKKDDYP
jgi:hypothetical protein